MKKFTLGVITGITGIAVGLPVILQLASAASSSSAPSSSARPIPSQACVQALTAKDEAELSTIDAMFAARKSAIQAHKTALAAAALIADDAERQAAVQKANEDFRTAMKDAKPAEGSAMQTAMETVRTACGNAGGFGGFGKGPGGPGMFGDRKGGGRMMNKGQHRGWDNAPQAEGQTETENGD